MTGDYTEEEKIDYIRKIKKHINLYIDKNNKAKMFLLKKYDKMRTPFLLILTKKGETKYWQFFEPDEIYGYKMSYEELSRLLEDIL